MDLTCCSIFAFSAFNTSFSSRSSFFSACRVLISSDSFSFISLKSRVSDLS
ncbi:hypothetical protein HanXRQr2_Chr13g0612351 [Helianthus annuus]|uniref:Uncharacterized protein n=1 Tax=Helianthus annuus TaxID=4232 RepID=A0A9K3EM28_HELAN|nr:hypothetical protein HanXRQr2_Chr13g0612351 [Helianthus annuus]KAJ0851214.1 hypothetical protein HanPSC8_Chr13g0589681 [Helianthus annuus]